MMSAVDTPNNAMPGVSLRLMLVGVEVVLSKCKMTTHALVRVHLRPNHLALIQTAPLGLGVLLEVVNGFGNGLESNFTVFKILGGSHVTVMILVAHFRPRTHCCREIRTARGSTTNQCASARYSFSIAGKVGTALAHGALGGSFFDILTTPINQSEKVEVNDFCTEATRPSNLSLRAPVTFDL